jgi:hypothetical protein
MRKLATLLTAVTLGADLVTLAVGRRRKAR